MADQQNYEAGQAPWIEVEIKSQSMSEELSKVLSAAIVKVSIKNDIANEYPVIQISFSADNQLFIENNIFPHEEYELKIHCIEDSKKIQEPVIMNLIVVQENVSLVPKFDNNVSTKRDIQTKLCCFTCIPRQAYQIMTYTVNRLWEDKIDPYNAVMKLIEDVGIESKQIEDKGKNEYKIPQLLVPPTTFPNAIDDLNTMYGIYKNEMHRYIRYNGTFEMWDKVEHFNSDKSDGEIKIFKLPSYSDTRGEEIKKAHEEAKKKPDTFITYSDVQTISRSNDGSTSCGNQQTFIYHPDFDIAYYKNTELLSDETIKKHAVLDGQEPEKKLKFNDIVKTKKSISLDEMGMFNVKGSGKGCCGDDCQGKINDSFICRRHDKELQNYNMIKIGLERQVKIHYLMRVGHTLKLTPISEHETFKGTDYEGSYILLSSQIDITRSFSGSDGDIFNVVTELICGRSNQSYK